MTVIQQNHVYLLRLIALMLLALVYGCSSLPKANEADRPLTTALSGETILGRQVSEVTRLHRGQSGFSLIYRGKQAYIYRSQLAEMAEESIDAQYYIWHDDVTGKLLAARMIEAANRGVRVRLLLDDVGSGSSEKMLAVMNAHPNIDVRIYNPVRPGMRFGIRKLLSFIFEFSRLNQRMHNKTYTVDGSIAIAGGRNIGDEYFDHHPEENFIDLDLMVIGENVPEIANSFDDYWNSPAALPLSVLKSKPADSELKQTEMLTQLKNPSYQTYPWLIQNDDMNLPVNEIISSMTWGNSDFVYDQPLQDGKAVNGNEAGLVWQRLSEELQQAENDVMVESAYFIVLDKSMKGIKQLRDSGVNISVLTNSLVTNDLWLIHSGYSTTREGLLLNGVRLYELRPDAASCNTFITEDRLCEKAKVSLHAKSAVIDQERVYIGSFNLNPRSAYLNSEMAFIINSKALAQAVTDIIEIQMQPENSWTVSLDEHNEMQWTSQFKNETQTYSHDPESSLWQRIRNSVFSIFPFDKYY